ncbi:hypothetical protein Vretimale_9427 [Volvox reticuliferus]|uniref:Inosine/uridine-preferring nucleoside hydrolase domain-containing protein n=2 Tax=Volvox reticuliferus TaxID=1737510 RepID=A0A8J4GCP4_9CHLO|nr:hypothetical protein Vretifemale_9934 [Volvox reticuliferus]GIM04923.1 hypothetical protein Vretimale_9427 [Volvox reticuliferus]
MSTSRIACNRSSGGAEGFHGAGDSVMDGSVQPTSNAAPTAAAAPAAAAAAASGDFGTALSAAEALVAAARGSPGQLVVVALGPLTNLALALRIEPQLPSLIRALLVLGGGEGENGGNVTPYAEFNFHADPEAAAEVVRGFGSAVGSCRCRYRSNGARGVQGVASPGENPRVALVTWRCCQQNLLRWEVVDELMSVAGVEVGLANPAAAVMAEGAAASPGPTLRGSFIKGILAPFLARWRRDSPDGMLLGDPLAVAVATGLQPTRNQVPLIAVQRPHRRQQEHVKHAEFETVSTQPPQELGTSLNGGLDPNLSASDHWGGLVLDCYVAPCRVELQGERRGACMYGSSQVKHDTTTTFTKADVTEDAHGVLHANAGGHLGKGPDDLSGAEASPDAEMRLVTVIRSVHMPTVAEMLRQIFFQALRQG